MCRDRLTHNCTRLPSVSVRARLTSQQGLSFTEFTYQLLQAYDFYYLHKHFGCSIQVGGSDQWGNIVAGLELIGKMEASHPDPIDSNNVYGFTTPLLTTSTGEKFGKSAGNAVWLDSSLTSVFDFYQVCKLHREQIDPSLTIIPFLVFLKSNRYRRWKIS